MSFATWRRWRVSLMSMALLVALLVAPLRAAAAPTPTPEPPRISAIASYLGGFVEVIGYQGSGQPFLAQGSGTGEFASTDGSVVVPFTWRWTAGQSPSGRLATVRFEALSAARSWTVTVSVQQWRPTASVLVELPQPSPTPTPAAEPRITVAVVYANGLVTITAFQGSTDAFFTAGQGDGRFLSPSSPGLVIPFKWQWTAGHQQSAPIAADKLYLLQEQQLTSWVAYVDVGSWQPSAPFTINLAAPPVGLPATGANPALIGTAQAPGR